jgi:hypothetical protein
MEPPDQTWNWEARKFCHTIFDLVDGRAVTQERPATVKDLPRYALSLVYAHLSKEMLLMGRISRWPMRVDQASTCTLPTGAPKVISQLGVLGLARGIRATIPTVRVRGRVIKAKQSSNRREVVATAWASLQSP